MSTPGSNYPPPPRHVQSPPITVVLTIVLLIFFLVGFFSIYFCRCFMDAILTTWNFRRTPSGNLVDSRSGAGGPSSSDVVASHNGLDPALIKSFPTFVYSSVKDVSKENKYGLECAICLVEFENDSLLRLLTVCYHVFHQECVDLWLESHKTCPVCRRDLDSPAAALVEKSPEPAAAAVRIDIEEDGVQQQPNTLGRYNSNNNNNNDISNNTSVSNDNVCHAKRRDEDVVERFSRSHSTGHSIVRRHNRSADDQEDRYTLRLPEHLKMKLSRGGHHHWTGSCETFGEFKIVTRSSNGGFGEVSGV